MTSQEEDILRRITELESMFMHLQQDYEALNETVLMNAGRLDRIVTRLTDINDKLESSLDAAEQRNAEDEKPPHY